MKPARFTYHDPTTVGELVSLLESLEDVKLLAGGQSLMPMLNLRLAQPDHVIDLNTVSGLGEVRNIDEGLRIGAMVRQVDLMKDAAIGASMPIMAEALQWVGHFQTRTRGTIGGSMAHLDPAAELPVIALLYDAELGITGAGGERSLPMVEWPLAYMLPNLAEDEVLTAIDFSTWTEPHGWAFEEFARRHGDFAIVAVGALLSVVDGVIERAAVAIAGNQPTPQRLGEVEAALIGQPSSSDTFRNASAMAGQIEAMSDAYVDARYRQRLARVLTERALTKAATRAEAAV